MTRSVIHNPILRGFHPDPSIVRVGDDYYIATSTFEWWPGVRLHHSRDLVHWRSIGYALTRRSQLDMLGDPDSGGVWAPCLSYSEGTYYLIFTDVKNRDGDMMDCHNYLVTAPEITGPWSDPVFLNSSGFDPSLFHDDDGRKWLLNMLWDYRPGRTTFAGIVLQEYSLAEKRLVGEVHSIFAGTALGVTEGPHLYKHAGMYYLMTAEGGTVYDHAVTMARAPAITGPYEVDPANPILTSAANFGLELQKAGHASLVETQRGEWYLAHLCGRPLRPERYCNLGRETALQKVHWTEDGWLRLDGAEGAGRGNAPRLEVAAPALPPHPLEPPPERDDFDAAALGQDFNTLRLPADESWLSLRERPGYLRLRGRESLSSRHRQSLVARRQQAFRCEVETALEFAPHIFQQLAGLVCYYDARNYLYLSFDEEVGRCLNILHCDRGALSFPLAQVEPAPEGTIRLKLVADFERIQLFYAAGESAWRRLGPTFRAAQFSDEYDGLGFTSTFLGLCVQDLSGQRLHADFDYFSYRELSSVEAAQKAQMRE